MNYTNLFVRSVNYEQQLEDITWTLEMSQGQFSLILACCNSTALRTHLVHRLHILTPGIQEIYLNPSDQYLYSKIQESFGEKQPQAVMILNLELVTNINQILTSINQVREELWKHCPVPIILWINDAILKKMIRLTPDFESWASITDFRS